MSVPLSLLSLVAWGASAGWLDGPVRAQPTLTGADFDVVGVTLRVSPEAVFVPKGIPGSIAVELVTGTGEVTAATASLATGAHVEGVLRGPSFPAQRVLGVPGQPLMLPPLHLEGEYRVDEIRLVETETNATLMEGSPRGVPVTVFSEVLVARVESRPLTLEEIQDRGIVIDDESFGAYEFEMLFVFKGQTFPVTFPVVAPTFDESTEIIPAAELEELLARAEEINDQLALTAELPPELEASGLDLQVKGLIFQEVKDDGEGEPTARLPGIPGVMVIPGNIGYLNQFFSVQLFVSNAAPLASNLDVHSIEAELVLPPGKDQVRGTSDDPLDIARVGPDAVRQLVLPIKSLGPDGQPGTADDGARLKPGETGQAEFLVEGQREGLHLIDIAMRARLSGLAAGDVELEGRAVGSVLVRNPRFSITFAHPRTIRSNEPYTATVTVLNTGESDANLVSVSLAKASISGASLVSDETVQLGTLEPGQAGLAEFRLIGRKTGFITLGNVSGDDEVSGSFDLTMGVDERGVALSPAALGYPAELDSLPAPLRAAADRVLGQALSVATAGLLPPGVIDLGRPTVITRVLELAEAGQRLRLGDPPARVFADLTLDWQGGRAASAGFDQLLRETDAGRAFREALAATIEEGDGADTTDAAARLAARATDLAGRHEAWWITATSTSAITPTLSHLGLEAGLDRSAVPDAAGYRGAHGHWLVARPPAPSTDPASLRWDVTAAHAGAVVALLELDASGTGKRRAWNVTNAAIGTCYRRDPLDPARLVVDVACDGIADTLVTATTTNVVEAPPTIIKIRQDLSVVAGRPYWSCYMDPPYINYGTVLGVLFSKPMTPAGVERPAGYTLDSGVRATSVRLQPGGRVALVNLRDPVGTFVPHTMTIAGVADPAGAPLVASAVPIEATADRGFSVKGRVLGADGAGVAGVPVTLIENDRYASPIGCVGVDVRLTQRLTDADGGFAFEFLMAGVPFTVAATDTSGLSGDALAAVLSSVSGGEVDEASLAAFIEQAGDAQGILEGFAAGSLGQAIVKAQGLDRAIVRDAVWNDSGRVGTEVPIVLRFRGRGAVSGRVLEADGVTPRADAAVNLFPDPDSRELGRGMFSASNGAFAFAGVPLGVYSIEVTTGDGLRRVVSGRLTVAGEEQTIDVVLSATPVPTGSLAGQVVEVDGVTPHGGGKVVVRGFGGSVSALVTAGPDGYFVVPDVAIGQQFVAAISFDGQRKGEAAVNVTAGAETWVKVSLQGRATVAGKVQYANGLPAKNALVAGGEALVRTDDAGLFVTEGVPTGHRVIAAAVERDLAAGIMFTRFGAGELVVSPTGPNFVVVTLEQVGRLEGFVRNAQGAPLGDVKVALPQPTGFFVTTTNVGGLYAFDRLGVGPVLVSAPAPGVSEEVQAELDAEPPAQATDALAAVLGIFDPPLVVGDPALGPGTWGYTYTRIDFDGQVKTADVQLQVPGDVSGVVLNHKGVPIQATVVLRGVNVGKTGAPASRLVAQTESDPGTGVFSFAGAIFAGDFQVAAYSAFYPYPASFEGRTSTVEPHAEGLVLQLEDPGPRQGRITGTVLMPDGSPAPAGVPVAINWTSDYAVETVEGGRFDTQIDLPWGDYRLHARDPDTGLQGEASVRVTSGTVDVTVRLIGLGDLRVEVVDADGDPASDAEVTVTRITFPDDLYEGETDEDGAFELGGVFAGTYYIKACKLGASLSLCGRGEVELDEDAAPTVRVTLEPTGSLSGTFLAADRATPIGFAQIAVEGLGLAVTDALGTFAFDEVPLGSYQVTGYDAPTGRYARARADIDAPGQHASVTLVVAALGEIVGTVIDSDGASTVAGASVSLSVDDPFTPERTVTTDPAGGFAFPGFPIAAFSLSASHPVTHVYGVAEGALTDDAPRAEVEITLEPLADVDLVVLRPDGAPAALARVRLGSLVKDAGPDGRARFTALPLGTYGVRATSAEPGETHSVGEGEVVLDTPGEAPAVTVRLLGVGAIEGTVETAGGAPVQGAVLALRATSGPLDDDWSETAITDALGTFAVDDVPLGTIVVVADDGTTGASGEVVIEADGQVATLDLVLGPTGSLKGKAVAELGGQPMPGAQVTARFESVGGLVGVRLATTDGAGDFTLASLPVGLVELKLEHVVDKGLAFRDVTLTTPGATLDLGTITLDQTWPTVTATTPTAAATGVPTTTTIVLELSEPLDPLSVTAQGFRLAGPAGDHALDASYTFGGAPARARVTLTPDGPLASDATYTVAVIGGLVQGPTPALIGPTDLVGRPLLQTFTTTFSTRDDIPPALVSVSPDDGQIQVDVTSTLRLVWDEPIDIGAATATLTGPGGAVAGRFDRGLQALATVFTPTFAMSPNTTYTYSVTGVRDLAGNVGPTVTGGFTTIDTIGPTITTLRLLDGAPPLGGATVVVEAVLANPAEAGVRVRMSAGLVPFGETAPGGLTLPLTLPLSGNVSISAFAIDAFGNFGPPKELPLTVIQVPQVDAGPDRAADEGETVSLAVTWTDDSAVTHTATVDWGDGAGPVPATVVGFTVTGAHAFRDDGAYDVTVCVRGAGAHAGCDAFRVTVTNRPPIVGAAPRTLDEGTTGLTTLTTFSDPGADDTHSATVDLGDGAAPATLAGSNVRAHVAFADDAALTAEVVVRDDDGGEGTASVPITVRNVAPVVNVGADQVLGDSGRVLRGGAFTDPGADDWTATVDWDDGQGPVPLPLSGRTFTLDHTYAAIGSYMIVVTVDDGDGGVDSDDFTLDVQGLAPAALTVPSDVLVSPGLVGQLPIRASRPAPAGGLTVTLVATSPSIASVPASVTIPAGQVLVNAPVTAGATGTTTIAVSAAGWIGASATVTIKTVHLLVEPDDDYVLAVDDERGHQLIVDALAPPGGLTVTITSDDEAVVEVSPETVVIPEGTLLGDEDVTVTAVGEGQATLTFSVPGLAPVEVLVTTGVAQLASSCEAGTTIGVGLYHDACAVVSRVAGQPYPVDAPVTLGVTSAGRATATGVIAAGTSIGSLVIDGHADGADTLRVSAPGRGAIDLPVTVEVPRLEWSGVSLARTPQSPRDDVAVRVTHGAGITGARARAPIPIALGLAAGSTPGIVALEDAGGAPLAEAVIAAGAASTPVFYAAPPNEEGAYRLLATSPGVTQALSDEVTVLAPSVTLVIACDGDSRLAPGFRHARCWVGRLRDGAPAYDPVALPLTLTTDGLVTVAAATIPASGYYTFVTLTGVSLGDDTLVAADPSAVYASATLDLSVVPAEAAFFGLDTSRTPGDVRDAITIQLRAPGSPQALALASARTLDLSLVDASPAGIVQLFADATGGAPITSLSLAEGATDATLYVGVPTQVGSYRVRAAIAGLLASDSELVTVTPSAYTLAMTCAGEASTAVGFTSDSCRVDRLLSGEPHAPPEAVTITFASEGGRASVPSVQIAAGTPTAYVELQGLATGADVVTATASGSSYPYDPAELDVTVVSPTPEILGLDTTRTPLSDRDEVYIYPAGLGLRATQAMTLQVEPVDATPAGIVQLFADGSSAIPIAELTLAQDANWVVVYVGTPSGVGSYRLRVAGPGFTSDSALVTVSAGDLALVLPACAGTTQRVGRFLRHEACYVAATVNGEAYYVPEALEVSLHSSAPGVVSVPTSVSIPAGQTYGYFPIVGGALGSGAVTVSATGYTAADTIPVIVVTPELLLSGVPGTVDFTGTIYALYTRASVTEQLMPVDADTIITLATSSPILTTPTSVTLTGGTLYSPWMPLFASGSGTATLTASRAGFTSAIASVTADISTSGITLVGDQVMLSYLPGVTASASSEYGPGSEADKAIDHSLSTAWLSAYHEPDVFEHWQMEFASPVTVEVVRYVSGASQVYNPERATFTFYGAADQILEELEDVVLPTDGSAIDLPLTGEVVGVVRLRMDITSLPEDQNPYDQIGEIIVIGTD
ncbi:MAG: Ig-like domain-containing protein [Deltaproteobacteria bacterium]|nr:Ig-like domain-containing protein [Deltaproteobacteria bacterium]